jgi:long-subunit acyl-CoA synthetase (AMP-forming)
MARKLATGLKSLGLKEKSHVGLISKNCKEWVIADLAIMMAGYVSVPFFPTLKSNEIKHLIEFGEVEALFIGKLEGNWDEMKNGVKHPRSTRYIHRHIDRIATLRNPDDEHYHDTPGPATISRSHSSQYS